MVYALISVPLALHYLPRKQFGLWAVMTQVVGYITLIELGMTSSVARHLIDHKDRPADGVYGRLIQTGSLVLAVQGVMIFLAGFILSPLFARLLAIPADLQDDFVLLLRWQGAIVAFEFATRILTQIIYAHQRSDLSNYGDAVAFGLNLLAMWIAFRRGVGVYSILWAGGSVALFGAILRLIICWKWRMLPPWGAWGRPTRAMFKELFHYGKDVFLVTLGSQLTNASQTIIITRTLGLDLAAVWAVCTKLFALVGELTWRLFNYAEPMFAEMIVRGEKERLRSRFRDVVAVTGSVSALFAVILAVVNDPFVRVWTAGRIFWTPWNDVLLGLWLVVRSVVRCHTGLNFVRKNIGMLHVVVFSEGLAFVTLALLVSRFGGIPAILAASVVCALLVTANYGVRRAAQFFDVPPREVVFDWSANLARITAAMVPLAVLTWLISTLFPLKGRLVWDAAVLGICGGLLWLRFGIPRDLQEEAVRRIPPFYAGLLRKILPRTQRRES
jgi:O-antigen/teichoic acid export membrane protein